MTFRGIDPVALAKDTMRELKDDDVPGLAAELTYRVFLALFPFMIFLAALGGFLADVFDVANPADRFVELFGDQLPADARSVIETQVEEVVNARSLGLLSVGIVGALWAAAGGAGSLMKALNRAYDVPDSRPVWRQKLLAVGLVLAATFAILGSVGLLIATQVYGEDLADEVGLGSTFEALLRWGTYPLILLLLFGMVAFVFWAAPNADIPFRWITPGAVVFVVAWGIGTIGFSIYVANFASYNATYGALGGVVVLLLWFYLTNLVLLLGAEVNSVLDERSIGGRLAEQREKARAVVALKRGEEPRPALAGQPEAPAKVATGPIAAVIETPVAEPRERPRATAALGSIAAFFGGVALAAFAMRKFAR